MTAITLIVRAGLPVVDQAPLARRKADSAEVLRVSARYTAVQARSVNQAFQLSLGSIEGENPGQGASPGLAPSLLPDDAVGGVQVEPANCNDTGSQIEGSPTAFGQKRWKTLTLLMS
jgi:hypothetical protein